MDGGVWPSSATAMHERRRALAKPMPAGFATLLRPGTGALRRSGETSAPGEENCRCQNHFGMDDRSKRRLNKLDMATITKKRTAWLITWESTPPDRLEAVDRCKIVAILSPSLGKKTIKTLLQILYCSESRLTLCEKLYRGLAKRKEAADLFREEYANEINPMFIYGENPFLLARKVENLKCEESRDDKLKYTLFWIELPKFKYDEITGKQRVAVPERQEKYTYSPRQVELTNLPT
jgi:hypothetical protein